MDGLHAVGNKTASALAKDTIALDEFAGLAKIDELWPFTV
jgi:hypothetical protein